MSINKIFLFSLLIFSAACLKAQELMYKNKTLQPHPRLLLFAGEEKKLQSAIAENTSIKKVNEAIVHAANAMVNEPVVERIKTGRRLLGKSREALRRIFFLSYAYRLNGNEKYFVRAEKELLAISNFSDWNPTHFLDVAEMTMAAAIGYDWLFSKLPESSRQKIREAITTKGLQPSLQNEYNKWVSVDHNWNQVCHAGLSFGALAVYEDSTALAQRILDRAIQNIKIPMKAYEPNGVYPEGYAYWEYGTTFNVMFIDAMKKLFGQEYRYAGFKGFYNTPNFLLHMVGPGGKSFNFSDAGTNTDVHPAAFWFAAQNNKEDILINELKLITKSSNRQLDYNRLLPALVIWAKELRPVSEKYPQELAWFGEGVNPMAFMRTSWKDSHAIYVAAKGGSANLNHAHMDLGSFVMDANGQRWAMDFGMQNYESLESRGMSIFGRDQNARRWTIFRYVNQAHNTLTFNDSLQRVDGFAPLIKKINTPDALGAVFDLSAAYKGEVVSATRGIAIREKKYVVVQDEIISGDKAAKMQWTMVTPATAKIVANDRILLTQHGKELMMIFTSDKPFTLKTWSNDPPQDYDAPNPGTMRVVFESNFPANTSARFTVQLVPVPAKIPVINIIPLNNWANGK